MLATSKLERLQHYMHSLDVEARAEESLPETERQDYIDMIQSLRTMLNGQAAMLESMRKEHEDDGRRIAGLTNRLSEALLHISELTSKVSELTQQLANASQSAETHSSRNRLGNQNRYATTSKRGCPVQGNDTVKTRQQEKVETDTKDDLKHDGDGPATQDIDRSKVR